MRKRLSQVIDPGAEVGQAPFIDGEQEAYVRLRGSVRGFLWDLVAMSVGMSLLFWLIPRAAALGPDPVPGWVFRGAVLLAIGVLAGCLFALVRNAVLLDRLPVPVPLGRRAEAADAGLRRALIGAFIALPGTLAVIWFQQEAIVQALRSR